MKTFRKPNLSKGFSMVELLVVIAIIVILAGASMVAMGYVSQQSSRKKAEAQIKLLEGALEDYKSDNKEYPSNTDAGGKNASDILYKALYLNGVQNGTKIYLQELDPKNNKQGWTKEVGSSVQIVDPWGNQYLYRSSDSPSAVNPDFDLWSSGKDGKTNEDPKHKDSLDDIRNFN